MKALAFVFTILVSFPCLGQEMDLACTKALTVVAKHFSKKDWYEKKTISRLTCKKNAQSVFIEFIQTGFYGPQEWIFELDLESMKITHASQYRRRR